MDEKAREGLRELLLRQRVLSLAVLVEGEPAIGLLPFAAAPDFGALIVNASSLARHTKGLAAGAPFDALVSTPDAPELDPLQIPRVTLRGHVALLDPEGPAYAADRDAYLAKFPSAEQVLSLGGFRLYRLEPRAGRLVAGFAGALNLNRDHFLGLAAKA